MRSVKIAGFLCVAVVASYVCLQLNSASAQKTKGKTRPAVTKYLMRGIMRPNCASLGGLLKEDGPVDDDAWDEAACHAACLNEMSYLLMDDGRCPDGVWAEAAATTLREQSAAALAAIERRDLGGAKDAFGKLTKSCASCHKAHKGQ